MSLIALLAFYSIGNKNISSITETEIDDFLYAGNGLYGEIVESVGEIRYLSHHDLPNTVNFRISCPQHSSFTIRAIIMKLHRFIGLIKEKDSTQEPLLCIS